MVNAVDTKSFSWLAPLQVSCAETGPAQTLRPEAPTEDSHGPLGPALWMVDFIFEPLWPTFPLLLGHPYLLELLSIGASHLNLV